MMALGLEPKPFGPRPYALSLWHTAVSPLRPLRPGRADPSRAGGGLREQQAPAKQIAGAPEEGAPGVGPTAAGDKACRRPASCSPLREKGGKEIRPQKWRLLPTVSQSLPRLGKGHNDCHPHPQEGGGAQIQRVKAQRGRMEP